MTTLAYRDGVLAADSHGECNGWKIQFNARKVRKLRDGRLVGCCGQPAEAEAYTHWLANDGKGEKPKLANSTVIEVRNDGSVLKHEEGGVCALNERFVAFGSGMGAALGALHMGAGARRAIQIAARVDSGTGGRVQSVRLGRR